jgi:hypothetical protein
MILKLAGYLFTGPPRCQGGDRAWSARQALENEARGASTSWRRRPSMPRSSESVAALASALAKAQAELPHTAICPLTHVPS